MPIDPFVRQMDEYIRKHRLIARGDTVLIAVSGGIDSIVLLDALVLLGRKRAFRLGVVHFNHHLRGSESDTDEQFVADCARGYDLPFWTGSGDVEGLSHREKIPIQDAARRLRYEFFGAIRTRGGFKLLATGHQADDNAETMVMNFCRGAGVAGLSGIPAANSALSAVRPLLFATREMIASYAGRRSLRFREDSTNSGTEYTRNAVRHSILPAIRSHLNPGISGTLMRSARMFDSLDGYLQQQASQMMKRMVRRTGEGSVAVDRSRLLALPEFLQLSMLRRAASLLTSPMPGNEGSETMLRIANGPTGKFMILPGGIRCSRNRNEVLFSPESASAGFEYPVTLHVRLVFPGFRFMSRTAKRMTRRHGPNVEYVDAGQLDRKLVLRSWRAEDWFIPLGLRARKKVSDFFIDNKIPRGVKPSIPILCSGDSIVWICGYRLDDRFRVTDSTTSIIRLEYQRQGDA